MKFDMPTAVFCGLALIAAAIFFGSGSSSAVAHAPGQRAVSIDWADKMQKWREETESWIRATDRWIYRIDTEYKTEQDTAKDIVLAQNSALSGQLIQIETEIESLRRSLERTQKAIEIIDRRQN